MFNSNVLLHDAKIKSPKSSISKIGFKAHRLDLVMHHCLTSNGPYVVE